MALLTTTAGWLPKPASVRRARWRFAEGEIEDDELGRIHRAAIRDAVALQERIGLDVLVDGQLDRSDMITHFAERLEGMELLGLVRCFDNRYYRRPRIVGDVERPGPITVEGWKTASAVASKPVKAVLTGPYTLMAWSWDEHYATRRACCEALAAVVRAEVEDLLAAGAREIQIDEPALGSRAAETDLAVEALAQVTAGLRGRVRTWVQSGYGDPAALLERLFALPVDGLLLELANCGGEGLAALGDLPGDKLLAAGVIDVARAEVETPAVVAARVERLLAHVPAERLWLAPDAGLRGLEPAVAEAKLEALVAAAAAAG